LGRIERMGTQKRESKAEQEIWRQKGRVEPGPGRD
jgi:hypothetical protein